jgi:hypothetical protein
MMAGTWTLACLFWTAAAAPTDVVYLNQLQIKIPLEIVPAERQHIHEIDLYVSSDEGKNWSQVAACTPDKSMFQYCAPGDGLYWFALQVIDHQQQRIPKDIYQVQPARKVMIDTLRPQLRVVSAERKGETVEVAWECQEEHPDLASLRLEYRTADAPPSVWYTVPLEQTLCGRTQFKLNNPAPVSVRIQMSDLAKNQTVTEPYELPAASGVTTAALSSSGTSGPVVPAGGTTLPDPAANHRSPPASRGTPQLPIASSDAKTQPDLSATAPGSKPEACTGTDAAGRVAASSDHTGTSAVAPEGPVDPPTRHGKLPPLQVVKNKQVTLQYALDKVGPSGIGKVELWLTQDDGLSWRRYAEDPDVKAPMPSGKYQRTVDLPGEGVFGITLVVRSRAGLGKAPPKPGDPPQMRIEVDTTAPVAELFVPAPETGRRDALRLTWSAHDPNHQSLAANPITLEWAENKAGPWRTIAAHIPNTGKYVWQLPANMPDRVYLRLKARDAAGNEGVAETPEPQLVDLSEPEGTILGVVTQVGSE